VQTSIVYRQRRVQHVCPLPLQALPQRHRLGACRQSVCRGRAPMDRVTSPDVLHRLSNATPANVLPDMWLGVADGAFE